MTPLGPRSVAGPAADLPLPDWDRPGLHADCGNCAALCCVVLPFQASADFGFDKAAGEPCRNLLADNGCRIHAELRSSGFPGCARFDCFGAGQRLIQDKLGGRDWRSVMDTEQLLAAFVALRQLHEQLSYLEEAMARASDLDAPEETSLRSDLSALHAQIDAMAALGAAELAGSDRSGMWSVLGPLLRRVSAQHRGPAPPAASPDRAGHERRPRATGKDRPATSFAGALLMGADLRGTNMHRADLVGTVLIRADLSGADLSGADLLGADLRDARLDGADLRNALFLRQHQLDSAGGDRHTRISAPLHAPKHWTARRRA